MGSLELTEESTLLVSPYKQHRTTERVAGTSCTLHACVFGLVKGETCMLPASFHPWRGSQALHTSPTDRHLEHMRRKKTRQAPHALT